MLSAVNLVLQQYVHMARLTVTLQQRTYSIIMQVLVRTRVSCSLVLSFSIPGTADTRYIPANKLQNQRYRVLFRAEQNPCTAVAVCPYGASYYVPVPGVRLVYTCVQRSYTSSRTTRVSRSPVPRAAYLVPGTRYIPAQKQATASEVRGSVSRGKNLVSS